MERNEVDLSCVKVFQAEKHDLRCVLKESSSILLLPLFHPVSIDAEGTAVDQFADTADRVGISGQHVPGQRTHSAVTAVDPDTGEHADYQHLRKQNTSADESKRLVFSA